MAISYQVFPICNLNITDFDSFDAYEEQYNNVCSFVEETLREKNISIYRPINAITDEGLVIEGCVEEIVSKFSPSWTLDFVIFDDGSCGFIKPSGSWIKLNVDIEEK